MNHTHRHTADVTEPNLGEWNATLPSCVASGIFFRNQLRNTCFVTLAFSCFCHSQWSQVFCSKATPLVSHRGDKASPPLAMMQISVCVGGSASKMHRTANLWGRLLGKVQRSWHLSPVLYRCDSRSQGETSKTAGHREIPYKKFQPEVHCKECTFVSSLSFLHSPDL